MGQHLIIQNFASTLAIIDFVPNKHYLRLKVLMVMDFTCYLAIKNYVKCLSDMDMS